jgi:cell wall-associated NlpC family hydrolase
MAPRTPKDLIARALRKDVLGSNNTSGQAHSKLLTKGADVAGDIVYFVKDGVYDHVGIVISPGEMIDEPKTGLTLRVDKITSGYGRAIYKAYIFPIVG